MATFEYKAIDQGGETLTGIVVAASENTAYAMLKDRNLVIVNLKARRQLKIFSGTLAIFKRVKAKEMVVFARQLSVMISASVPLVRALKVLVRQTENVRFKSIISELADDVDGGAKLSQSMSKYPDVFSNFFVQMVRSAETTGRLDEILSYLADQTEKDYDLISRVKGALIYPIFIVSALIVVGSAMMIFVMPQLLSILSESKVQLPVTTRALIAISDFMRGYWWAILFVIIGLFVGYRAYRRTAHGKQITDVVKLRLPIFGNVFNKIYLNRFSRSLSTLITSGVPITHSLEIVSDVVGNTVYKNLTIQTKKQVEAGNSISSVFIKSKIVPLMLPQMMSIGEQSGKLDVVLDKVADFYGREVTNLLSNLVNLIEPIILILMGIAVGVLVSAILLPIYNLSSAI